MHYSALLTATNSLFLMSGLCPIVAAVGTAYVHAATHAVNGHACTFMHAGTRALCTSMYRHACNGDYRFGTPQCFAQQEGVPRFSGSRTGINQQGFIGSQGIKFQSEQESNVKHDCKAKPTRVMSASMPQVICKWRNIGVPSCS